MLTILKRKSLTDSILEELVKDRDIASSIQLKTGKEKILSISGLDDNRNKIFSIRRLHKKQGILTEPYPDIIYLKPYANIAILYGTKLRSHTDSYNEGFVHLSTRTLEYSHYFHRNADFSKLLDEFKNFYHLARKFYTHLRKLYNNAEAFNLEKQINNLLERLDSSLE